MEWSVVSTRFSESCGAPNIKNQMFSLSGKQTKKQVVDSRWWSIRFSISQKEFGLKTTGPRPAHSQGQTPPVWVLRSLSCLAGSHLWLLLSISFWPSNAPQFLLLPHGALHTQSRWPGFWVIVLLMGNTSAINGSSNSDITSFNLARYFLRAYTPQSKITEFCQEIIKLAEF